MLAIFMLSGGVGPGAMAQPRAANEDHESIEEVVEEHREVIELVAEGDDEPAEWARTWLREADGR